MPISPFYKPRPPATEKDAAAALIAEVGGLEMAAKITGKSVAVLQRYTDPGEGGNGRFINIHDAGRLEAVCRRPVVTEWLAHELGWEVVPLLPLVMKDADPGKLVAAIVRETADLFERYADSLRHRSEAGSATGPAEALAMLEDVVDAQRGLSRLRGVLTQISRGGDDQS